ncbi:MAG: DUF3604 domain-containing protein [Armatimonadota bacterium]|nr:DUF3604 domain-containing protein [Armatimonadota bacterium]
MGISRRKFMKTIGAAGAAAFVGGPGLLLSNAESLADLTGPVQDNNPFELFDSQVISPDGEGYADSPCIASDRNGAVWVAWLNRLEQDMEMVLVNERRGKWSAPLPVTEQPGKYETPCIACAPGGAPMIVWIKIDSGKWSLESSLYNGSTFGRPQTVRGGRGKALNPCLTSGKDNTFWLAWESYQKGRFRICVKQYHSGAWGKTVHITDGKTNAYNPALDVDPSGTVWVAYSAVRDRQRNVHLRRYDPGSESVGKEIDIAIGREGQHVINTNCNPSVLCDADGRVWVSYQRMSPSKTGLSYHGQMECKAVCYQDGQLWQAGSGKQTVLDSGNDHYPTLLEGDSGEIRLFSRASMELRRAWYMRASCLDSKNGWTQPVSALEDAELGRIGKPAVTPDGLGSFWIAWQVDDYLATPVEKIKSGIRVARAKPPVSNTGNRQPALREASAGEFKPTVFGRARPPHRTVKVGGEKYILLFGNLHEHTLFSRCWIDGSDGILDDNYRYGFDVEGYDFMAMTDHGFDLYEAAWRKTRRAAEFYDDPPYYVALPAYEWTFIGKNKPPSSGHRNVIFGSGEDAAKFVWQGKAVYDANLEESSRMDKVWNLLREKKIEAVTIPHHSADIGHPMDWDFHDPHFQCVVEMFQCRSSMEYEGCPRQIPNPTKYKGCYVQDALARGHRMGFIASGDHNAMGIGVAAVLVKEISRKGIIEALLAKRCYATTGDKIFVDFRVDGHIMGTEYAAAGKPRISAVVESIKPMTNAVIFKNNKVIYEMGQDELKSRKSLSIDFVDQDFSENSYYYLRVIQENKHIAWSSPVWADVKTVA